MTTNIRELLPLYALGALDPDEAAAVEAAIAADPALAGELDAYFDIAPTAIPGADLEARLMASIGGGKHESFATRMSSMFDVTVDRARELLGLIERKASWVNPIPGIHLVHFEGGPAYAAADCGFVRIEPGCTFPTHTHRGDEVSIILEGSVRDIDGKVLSAGDELVQTEGTEHHLVAGPEGVLYVARAMNGIEIGGQRQ
jgi:putative transcriptional regulator